MSYMYSGTFYDRTIFNPCMKEDSKVNEIEYKAKCLYRQFKGSIK